MATTYVHRSTLGEFVPVKVGPKVIVLKCTKVGILPRQKIGDITRTSPAGLKILYEQKTTPTFGNSDPEIYNDEKQIAHDAFLSENLEDNGDLKNCNL